MFLKLFWIQFKVKEHKYSQIEMQQKKQNSQSWVFAIALA